MGTSTEEQVTPFPCSVVTPPCDPGSAAFPGRPVFGEESTRKYGEYPKALPVQRSPRRKPKRRAEAQVEAEAEAQIETEG